MARSARLLLLALPIVACAEAVPTTPFAAPAAAEVDLDAPGPITHEAVVSARWQVDRAGLLDLTDPAAAGLEDGKHDIVLSVHVLRHPERGVFVVDTGYPAAPLPGGWLLEQVAADMQPVESLAAIVARQPAPLAGVLLTHSHLDHVLGLVDVPAEVPVTAGAGEERPANAFARLTHPVFRRGLGDRSLTTLDFAGDAAVDLDGIRALDLLGDGSLYALDVAGHTPGSAAYLARTADGPVLFTGDCSHTAWGWEHDVAPGTFTVDPEGNRRSLAALQALAAAHPSMRVHVGHEERPVAVR